MSDAYLYTGSHIKKWSAGTFVFDQSTSWPCNLHWRRDVAGRWSSQVAAAGHLSLQQVLILFWNGGSGALDWDPACRFQLPAGKRLPVELPFATKQSHPADQLDFQHTRTPEM
jgi:hypothetical protein